MLEPGELSVSTSGGATVVVVFTISSNLLKPCFLICDKIKRDKDQTKCPPL